MEEVIIVNKDPNCEYFCKKCLQLRLSFLDTTSICGNCGHDGIIMSLIHGLDKEALKEQYK